MKPGPQILTATAFVAFFCTATTAGAGVVVGDSPELELETLDGEQVSLQDFGGQVLLVDVWATWCAPCRRSMPFYSRLYEEHEHRDFEILAISVDEDRRAVEAFRRRHELSFSIVVDAGAKAARLLRPPSMPTAYLIDRRGVVRYRHVGFDDQAKQVLVQQLEILLSEKAPQEQKEDH